MQPEHRVVLTLLLQEVKVLLAPVEHVPACLPRVGGHLDPQVLLPLAGVTVYVVCDPLPPAVTPLIPPAGEAL